jgi:hypothetical protein
LGDRSRGGCRPLGFFVSGPRIGVPSLRRGKFFARRAGGLARGGPGVDPSRTGTGFFTPDPKGAPVGKGNNSQKNDKKNKKPKKDSKKKEIKPTERK